MAQGQERAGRGIMVRIGKVVHEVRGECDEGEQEKDSTECAEDPASPTPSGPLRQRGHHGLTI